MNGKTVVKGRKEMKRCLILLVAAIMLLSHYTAMAQEKKEIIDDGITNLLEGKSNVYQKLPSNAKFRRGKRDR